MQNHTKTVQRAHITFIYQLLYLPFLRKVIEKNMLDNGQSQYNLNGIALRVDQKLISTPFPFYFALCYNSYQNVTLYSMKQKSTSRRVGLFQVYIKLASSTLNCILFTKIKLCTHLVYLKCYHILSSQQETICYQLGNVCRQIYLTGI